MAYNFLRGDRDQPFLLPPDLRDWLPQDHLAWFVLGVIDQLDLAPFYRAHRDDGHGRPAYDPKLLLGVLLYAYASCAAPTTCSSCGGTKPPSHPACRPPPKPPPDPRQSSQADRQHRTSATAAEPPQATGALLTPP